MPATGLKRYEQIFEAKLFCDDLIPQTSSQLLSVSQIRIGMGAIPCSFPQLNGPLERLVEVLDRMVSFVPYPQVDRKIPDVFEIFSWDASHFPP
jgi:hypothetical protein